MARINYNKNTVFGAIVAGNTGMLEQALENFSRVKKVMDSALGPTIDYTKLEPMFGLDIGTGQAFYNTVIGFWSALGTIVGIADLDQG